ncbi:hypothetical protein DRE_01476 [Drechslerella stenobrocha 248]|uniref:DUF4110 domain-containing protein n=1 Tax=Drechslerella stenobrocha 248 TaxID=1043628 RepID=W7HKP4_9PEZI|nr:hypothetical protein DRE_01476 [Drechslerella stenobrocha 248]
MAKDKKAKAADKKARTAAKTSKKAAKKDKKVAKKRPGDDSDSDDQDIDSILEEYKQKQAQHMAIQESLCDHPPPVRANALLMAHPTNSRELFLFGGEIWTGTPPVAKFYNDLYVYNTERNEWRSYTSSNSPMPRSGAAMTMGGQGKPELWLFGGEFSSPKQGIFYHYADFWKLDCTTREWTKIEAKGSPSGRSGHRLTYWKNYIVLFGGFQATSNITTKYLNDLYLFDTNTHTWTAVPAPASYLAYPAARSSFSFLPHEHGAVLFGGYSRVKTSGQQRLQQSNKKKNIGPKIKDLPHYHADSWLLRINPNDSKLSRWEKRKKPGNMPATRVGITMAHHRGRGVMFGGVYDVEDSDEALESRFFDDMWVYAVGQNRFWEVKMRKLRKVVRKDGGEGGGGRRERGKQDELELLKNLALLESKAGVGTAALEPMDIVQREDKEEEEESKNPLAKVEPSLTLPALRFNCALAVQGDWLYLYGGTFEKGDVEVTFDEMYRVNLDKLDGVVQIFKRESVVGGEDEMDQDDDDDDEDDDDDSEMEDEEDEDEGGSEDEEKNAKAEEIKRKQEEGRKAKALRKGSQSAAEAPLSPLSPTTSVFSDTSAVPTEATEPESTLPLPLPFESLREFFVRTSEAFQAEVVEGLKFKPVSVAEATTVKEIRTAAFEMAERRWWDVREEVREEERRLEELGVTESVIMTGGDKGEAAGGGGPRRR